MSTLLNRLSSSHKSSAKVVDGKLILSFPGALKPVVWQMDFSHVKASALEVQESKEAHALVLKTPKGENVEIATFEHKADAVKGLLSASKALESAQGRIHLLPTESGGAIAHAPEKKKSGGRWMAPILAILLLIILITVWNSLSPQAPSSLSSVNGQQSQSTNSGEVGVPMSAEDFLRDQ